MNNGIDKNQPSGEATAQPNMEFFTSTAAMVFLKSLYDIGKDSGVIFGESKPFYQVINSEFTNDKHVVELLLNNVSSHSIKVLSLFPEGKRALTDSIKLELRETTEYFPNGNSRTQKYYKERDSWGIQSADDKPTYVDYPFLIKSNFSYRLRFSLPMQPKPKDDEVLGISLTCMVAELGKVKNREETVKVRLFWG